MAHVAPLPRAEAPEFEDYFRFLDENAGYVPNSFLTMARIPALLRGYLAFSSALSSLDRVDRGLKVLMSHLASSANGCRFCEAHTSHTASKTGVEDARIAAVWEFETSALFDEAERAALRLALAMGQSPNGVGPAHFEALRAHFDEEQIVEMVAAVCLFGFWNRWNDTLATDLERPVAEIAEALIGGRGWSAGRHRVAD
ncbi:MAG: carboxymuconolactone decarboxylase family protein [Myxococcota bacterium]